MKNFFLFLTLFTIEFTLSAQEPTSYYEINPLETETWRDSAKTGKDSLFENGNKCIEYYQSDSHLIRKQYHENGKLKAYGPVIITMDVDTEFVEDEYGDIYPIQVKSDWYIKPIGQYKEYHDNGVLKIDGQYNSQGKTGLWKLYGSNGKVQKSCNYLNGHLYGEYKEFGFIGWGENRKLSELIIGNFALVHHPHNWNEVSSVKIGTWETFNYQNELIYSEEYKWLGTFEKE